MKVGFTGTRNGMTAEQEDAFCLLIGELAPVQRFHHGACKGADADAARVVRAHSPFPTFIVAHPGASAHGGDNEWLDREALDNASEVRPTKTHFARNRDIVDETDLLIATPKDHADITQWTKGDMAYTVTYARKLGRPVAIILPSGDVVRRRWPVTHPAR